MANMFCLVGRIEEIIENGEKLIVKVKVPRLYKNENGDYDNDIVPVTMIGGIVENVKEHCSKNDVIGIKGRIENNDVVEMIVEKVTYLSSKKEEE